MSGQKPSVIPATEMDRLKARENSSGLITLEEDVQFKFSNGDKVRVNSGIFTGYSGIYDRDPNNRVRVLLDMLGRFTPVPLDEAQLEAV